MARISTVVCTSHSPWLFAGASDPSPIGVAFAYWDRV